MLGLAYRGDWPARLWGLFPFSREVAVVRHELPVLPAGGDRCRLVFVSDLHVGPTTPIGLLERAFEAIQAEAPDVLLLGGDYVFLEAQPRRLDILRSLVESVSCTTKLAVLGNHDLWTHDQAVVETLTAGGVRVLVNEAMPLPRPWTDVVVLGLDDPWTGHCDVGPAQAQTNGEPVRIVLCHSPDGLRQLAGYRFDLFVCGHTHGGHIAAPWGPIVMPHGRLCKEYPSGLRTFEARKVYVSRGVGGVELPMRTFAPSEIAVFDLVERAPD